MMGVEGPGSPVNLCVRAGLSIFHKLPPKGEFIRAETLLLAGGAFTGGYHSALGVLRTDENRNSSVITATARLKV